MNVFDSEVWNSPAILKPSSLQGLRIHRLKNGHIFIPLARELWRSAGRCDCKICKGKEGFWDTLSIPLIGTTYTVHYPELQTMISYQR